MRVRVLAFAQLRELLGAHEQMLELGPNASIADAWAQLAARHRGLDDERASTRAARNGAIAGFDEELRDGDELALLPPVGGG
jgi:molybdopterin converting factor small subunit